MPHSHHHGAGEAGGLLDVAGRAVGHVLIAEDRELSLAPAVHGGKTRDWQYCLL